MTEPKNTPSFDDAPTTPVQQDPYWAQPAAVPPTGPQQAPPPAWQPAGLSSSAPADRPAATMSWAPANGQAPEQPRSGGRGRWIVAIVATLILVVAGVGVAVFAMSSKSSVAIGPTFMPASTAMYVEARLDLPGTQRDSVVKLFSHFPGFADQAAFDLKIDETLDKLVGEAAKGAVTYSRDIKPWFSGQVAFGLLEVPAGMTGFGMGLVPSAEGLGPDSTLGETHALVGIGVKDRAKLENVLVTVRALAGGSFTEEQYGDNSIVTVAVGDAPTAAYAVTDNALILAPSVADLKKGLDVLAGSSPALSGDANFSAAMKDLPQDRLGAYYMSPAVSKASGDSLKSLGELGAGMPGMSDALKCVIPAAPVADTATLSGAIVAAGDHVAVQAHGNHSGAQPVRQVTDLAARMPADTMLYFETPKVGGSIHDLVACLRAAMPEAFANPQLTEVEKVLGTPVEDYLSFITDVGVGANYDGAKFQWGLVAGVDNEETAKTRVSSLLSMAKLAATLGGAPISVTEQQVNGVTVTTITLSDVPGLASLPMEPSISVAVGGGKLYIGGGDFASTALARPAADSLASNQRFSSAMTAAGNPNGLSLYLDIDAVRQRIEAAAGAMSPLPPSYIVDTQPYLKPFDRLVMGNSSTGDTTTSRILVFVK